MKRCCPESQSDDESKFQKLLMSKEAPKMEPVSERSSSTDFDHTDSSVEES